MPRNANFKFVMPGLVPGIHVFAACEEDLDGRDKPGHDDGGFGQRCSRLTPQKSAPG